MSSASQPTYKILIPTIIGNLLEWYDISLYGFFAGNFARLYFPEQDRFLSLVAAFGLFAASYFMRPIGAIVFGYIGDNYGRKKSLIASIFLMALCSFALCFLPTHAQLGMTAGVLLTVLRLLQGFAVGGEYSGASIILIESAAPKRKTFNGSLALSSAYAGFLVSSAVGTLISILMSQDQLNQFGWRIAFAIGGCIAIVGFYFRSKLIETAAFKNAQHKANDNPVKILFLQYPKQLLTAIGMIVLPAGYCYTILVFFGNYLKESTNLTSEQIFSYNTVLMLFIVLIIPIIGFIADKVGRKKIMYVGVISCLIFCIPLFKLLTILPLLALVGSGCLSGLYEANTTTEIASMFPTQCRFTGLALTLNLTNGIVGGLTPMICAGLIHITNMQISPMFYIITLAIISLCAISIRYKTWSL